MASGPSQLPYTRDPDSPIASSPDILQISRDVENKYVFLFYNREEDDIIWSMALNLMAFYLLVVARSVFPESSALALPSGLFKTSASFLGDFPGKNPTGVSRSPLRKLFNFLC